MQFFVADDGARLAYLDEGQGLPVLALAGLTRDHKDFDYLARHLTGCRLIRLDARGRGASDYTGPATYTLARETGDVIGLLGHLGLPRVAIIGSSRGGLIGLILGAVRPDLVCGLCLNDVGPAVERAGLLRIGQYIGQTPSVATLDEAADRLAQAMPGFSGVPMSRWAEEAVRHYVQGDGRLDLPYDPALRVAFEAALPMALIRGSGSDVLSPETAAEMKRRRPDLIVADVPDRGHIPFLDEAPALAAIDLWLSAVRARLDQASGGA